jgi:hypothetical protein
MVHERNEHASTGSAVIEEPRSVSEEDDPIGQLIATIVSAAEALEQAVALHRPDGSWNPSRARHLNRMAHKAEIDMLAHAATQIQFAASNASVVMEANEQITWEDRKLVRIK